MHIETEDFYKDMEEDIDMYDTSNLPEDHPLFSVKNQKQLYKMKCEAKGNIIVEFIGLKSKMYCYKMIDRKTGEEVVKKKAKGLLKTTRNGLTHEEYYDSLSNFKCNHYVRERKFQCKNHKITTIIQNRMGINAFDDKSYILDDGITQLRHNHWRVKAYKVMREWCIGHRQKRNLLYVQILRGSCKTLRGAIKMIKKRVSLRPWSVKHIVNCWAKKHIKICEEKQLRSVGADSRSCC